MSELLQHNIQLDGSVETSEGLFVQGFKIPATIFPALKALVSQRYDSKSVSNTADKGTGSKKLASLPLVSAYIKEMFSSKPSACSSASSWVVGPSAKISRLGSSGGYKAFRCRVRKRSDSPLHRSVPQFKGS